MAPGVERGRVAREEYTFDAQILACGGGSVHVLVVDERAVGHRLGQTVYDESGRVLLNAGTALTSAYIASLRHRGYRTVYGMNDLAPDLMFHDAIREETRARATVIVRDTLRKAAVGRSIDVHGLRDMVDQILEDLRGNSDVAFSVSTLRSVDEYTFAHSVNVCIFSLILGMSLALDQGAIRQLGIGALLHDIGKMNYLDLVNKPGRLTPDEFTQMQQHTTDGYEMLRQHNEVHLFSAHVAYQHHERLDGSGYPRGLRNEQILRFARIAAVADVYDAITSDRPYSAGTPPHEAMHVLLSEAGSKFDSYMVRQFAQRIAVYPVGAIVLLADGRIGVVCDQSEDGPSKPRVRVLTDLDRHLMSHPEEMVAEGKAAVASVLSDYPPSLRRAIASAGAGE